jgi:hypothetical protein
MKASGIPSGVRWFEMRGAARSTLRCENFKKPQKYLNFQKILGRLELELPKIS